MNEGILLRMWAVQGVKWLVAGWSIDCQLDSNYWLVLQTTVTGGVIAL